ASLADLERAEHGDVDVTAPDHREAGCAVEVRRSRNRRDRTLGGVDEVGVQLVLFRPGADAEEPVLRVQVDLRAGTEVSRNEVGNANAEIHDLPRAELLRRACRDEGLGIVRHDASTRWSTYRWGVAIDSGSSSPTGTTSPASAIVIAAAVAMSGLKLRAV